MTTIGYATLQIIPSLKGVSEAIDKQLGGMGKNAGRQLGGNLSAGLAEAVNRRSGEKVGQEWADSTAAAMAQHLQSAKNSSKLQSSLTYLVKNGDAAGKQFARDMASNLAIELPVQTRAQQVGEKVGTVIGRSIGLGIKGAIGVGAAGLAGIGYTLTKGFERLESIDAATFKLKALGHSAEETKSIMDNATAAVKGTAFSLSEAATTAASAVAAGIKPGQDLTRYLGATADAAAVAGTSMKDMGDIFNGIQTQNKAYTGDLDQLASRGIPIFQWLQQEYGVTGDALTKMVEKGQVDAAHFQDAIVKNIGEDSPAGRAAKNMGQSFQGAVDNMETSIARVGAHFLGSIFGDKDGSQLAGPTEAITKLTEKFDKIDVWVQAHGPQIHQFFATMVADAQAVGKPLGEIAGFLGQHPQLIAAVAAAFALWKTGQAIAGITEVVTKIRGMGTDLDEMPGKASSSAAGISRALALIVVPEIGKELNDQLNQWLAGHPTLDRLNQGNTPDKLGARAAQGINDALSPKPTGPSGPAQIGPNNQVIVAPPPTPGKNPLDVIAGRATGGAIFGAGGATSDSIPALLSNGEHVLTAADVKALGGQGGVYALRSALHGYAGGGAAGGGLVPGDQQLRKIIMDRFGISDIGGWRPADKYGEHSTGRALDVMVGNNKAKGEAVKNFAIANADAIDLKWAIWQQKLWYPDGSSKPMEDRGSPTQNHMDHVHIFSGTGITKGLRGSLQGDTNGGVGGPGYIDPASSDQTSAFAGGSATGSVTAGGGDFGGFTKATGGASSSGGGSSFSLPAVSSSLSGFGSSIGEQLGTQLSKAGGGQLGDLGKLGSAAGSVIDGQVGSLLDVFGVPSSPGWLKGISTLIGGISIGGGGGGGAGPLAAAPNLGGFTKGGDPGNMHGLRAGQAPGVTYNIQARDTEDAFVKAQRIEREKAAAKLSRF